MEIFVIITVNCRLVDYPFRTIREARNNDCAVFISTSCETKASTIPSFRARMIAKVDNVYRTLSTDSSLYTHYDTEMTM